MSRIMEKEVRGALNKSKASEIAEYTLKHNWKMHAYKQVSIYCNTDHIPGIGTVTGGKGRLILDIRDNAIKSMLDILNTGE